MRVESCEILDTGLSRDGQAEASAAYGILVAAYSCQIESNHVAYSDLRGQAQVDRRAARACKIDELGLRRQEKITASELAAVFKQFLDVLQRELEPEVYFRVVPVLRQVTVGSAGEGKPKPGSLP